MHDKEYRKRRYWRNHEKAKAKARAWINANRQHIYERDRQRRETNKDDIRAKKKKYYDANAERLRKEKREWYAANKQDIRAKWVASQTPEKRFIAAKRTRQWEKENPERKAELRKKWAQENADKIAIKHLLERARKHGIPADPITVAELMADQDYVCYLCRDQIDPDYKFPDPMSPSIDHIVPIRRGGTSLRDNLAATHLRCNLVKGNRLLSEMKDDGTS